MLNTSIEFSDDLHGPFSDHWSPLHNKISKMARKRAQIAHFVIHQRNSRDPESDDYLLHPFWSVSSYLAEKNVPALSAEEIRRRARSFGEVSDRVYGFRDYVEILRGRMTAADVQKDDPLDLLRNPNAQTPKES